MNSHFEVLRHMLLAGVLSLLPAASLAREDDSQPGETGAVQLASPVEKGDAAGRSLADKLKRRGPLPFGRADVEAKAAADRARDLAMKAGQTPPASPARAGRNAAASPQDLATTQSFAGQGGNDNLALLGFSLTPPAATGAVGPDRYVQLVNSVAAIYSRITGSLINQGTLNQLANVDASVSAFASQVIWDAQKNRFFYVVDVIYTSTDSRLAFGFSKTGSPGNLTSDWCHYTLKLGARLPDSPKLGDSAYFLLVGANSFDLQTETFLGSDIIAFEKPPAGAACPIKPRAFIKRNLKDDGGRLTFAPAPANQIDSSAVSPMNKGYVAARNGSLPSDKLWFYKVAPSFNPDGTLAGALFGSPKGIAVGSYGVPASAVQPNTSITLRTLDARLTQAVQALNPQNGRFSFWTQHTIATGSVSGVRYYQIDPTPSTGPVVLTEATITVPNTFVFNGAIAPDRQRNGSLRQFEGSYVVQYNVSSSSVFPGIQASSSVNGGALTGPTLIVNGTAAYQDFNCAGTVADCDWSDTAGAAPDPNPTAGTTGAVWGTNQYATGGSTSGAPWATQIFNVKP